MQCRAKCGICNKLVRAIPVEQPRVKGEVNYICKEHGIVNSYVKLESK